MKVTIKKKTSVRKSPTKMNLTEPILKNFPILHSPIKEGKILPLKLDATKPKENVPLPPHVQTQKAKQPDKMKTPQKKVKTPQKPKVKTPPKMKTPQKPKTPKMKTPQKPKTPPLKETPLEKMTVKQLKEILSKQGKPLYGTKAVLIQRIRENKKENKQASPIKPNQDYNTLTIAQLKTELKKRGLPVSGKKADLVERLRNGKPKTPAKRGRKPKVTANTHTPKTKKDFQQLTVVQLKALLKAKGKTTSGNKAQLVDRLLDN